MDQLKANLLRQGQGQLTLCTKLARLGISNSGGAQNTPKQYSCRRHEDDPLFFTSTCFAIKDSEALRYSSNVIKLCLTTKDVAFLWYCAFMSVHMHAALYLVHPHNKSHNLITPTKNKWLTGRTTWVNQEEEFLIRHGWVQQPMVHMYYTSDSGRGNLQLSLPVTNALPRVVRWWWLWWC